MINKIFILTFILMISAECFSQDQAKIEYRYINFTKQFISSNDNKPKQKTPGYEIHKTIEKLPFVLTFDGSKSVFKIKKRMGVGDKSITYNQLTSMLPQTYIDYKNKTRYDYAEFSGQTFLVKEKLNVNWKLIDEIKLIKGYKCRKAVQVDDNKNIKVEAWFVPEIPLSVGPSYYAGLPGLVISTKQFNKKGEAYAGYEFVNIDFSKQKEVNIPNHETITEREFADIMRGARN